MPTRSLKRTLDWSLIALLAASLACTALRALPGGVPVLLSPQGEVPTPTLMPTDMPSPTPIPGPSPTLTPFHQSDAVQVPPERATEPARTEQQGPAGAPIIALTVVNRSSATVCYLYISPGADADWGEDRLGPNVVLEEGDQAVVMVAPGLYDLNASDCDQEPVATQWQVLIDRDTTWNIGQGFTEGGAHPSGPTIRLTIINATQQTVCYLFISPSGEPSWGSDWLNGTPLAPGDQVDVEVTARAYDLKAEDCNHRPITIRMGFSIQEEAVWRIEVD